MSILGVIVRMRPDDVDAVASTLAALPGVDVALNPGDGRLVIVIEDAAGVAAAATLGQITLLPQVLNTSLVYEYSGPDAPSSGEAVEDYGAWRANLKDLARGSGPGA